MRNSNKVSDPKMDITLKADTLKHFVFKIRANRPQILSAAIPPPSEQYC